VSTFKFRGQLAQQNDKHQAIMITASRASEGAVVCKHCAAPGNVMRRASWRGFSARKLLPIFVRSATIFEPTMPYCRTALSWGSSTTLKYGERSDNWMEVVIDTSSGAPGLYHRWTTTPVGARGPFRRRNFQLFVSVLVCKDYEETAPSVSFF